jgi:hypothetical protein
MSGIYEPRNIYKLKLEANKVRMISVSWEVFCLKQLCSFPIGCSLILLGGLKKTTKNSVTISHALAWTRSKFIPNKSKTYWMGKHRPVW